MSFQVIQRKPDLIFLSSTSKSAPVSIQIDKNSSYKITLVNDKAYYATEQGRKFYGIITKFEFKQNRSWDCLYYTFKTLGDMAEICDALLWQGMMNQASFNEVEPFFVGVNKVSRAWGETLYLPEASSADQDEDVDGEADLHEGVLAVLGEKSLLSLYFDKGSEGLFREWLKLIGKGKSPRKCLGFLFMTLRKEQKQLPLDALNALWEAYGTLLLKIEQKTHVIFLFDLLHVSEGFKFLEILGAILSQNLKKLTSGEIEFLLEKVKENSSALGGFEKVEVLLLKCLKENPQCDEFVLAFAKQLVEDAPVDLLLRAFLLLEAVFLLQNKEEELSALWMALRDRIAPAGVTAETLQFHSMLFSHIPPVINKSALGALDKWLDQLFGFYFDLELTPSLSPILREIQTFQREHYPHFLPSLRDFPQSGFTKELKAESMLEISGGLIILETVITAVNLLAVGVSKLTPKKYAEYLDKLWEMCLPMLQENRPLIRLLFLEGDCPQLYLKFIEKLTRFRPKNENAAFFVMGFTRFHLMNYIDQFPGRNQEICFLIERFALMRMPNKELFQDLHQQAIQLFVGRHHDRLLESLEPFSLFKLRLLGNFEADFTMSKKGGHLLYSQMEEFAQSLLGNGSFFHLIVVDEFRRHIKGPFNKDFKLDDKVSDRLERHLDGLYQSPPKITRTLKISPRFIGELIKRFAKLSATSDQWEKVFAYFASQIVQAEDYHQFNIAFFEMTAFLNFLLKLQYDVIGVTAGKKLYPIVYPCFVKIYSDELGRYRDDPLSKEANAFRDKFLLISRQLHSHEYLKCWLLHPQFPSDILWNFYRLHHDVYASASSEEKWFYELVTSFTLFQPLGPRLIEDQEQFLNYQGPILKDFELRLSQKKCATYMAMLTKFILGSADEQEDHQKMLNNLNLLQLLLVAD